MDGGISVWVPVISTLAGGVVTGGVALLVSWLNHRYAREREENAAAERLRNEKLASEEKLARERYFIATELVFLLEQFAEGCTRVATDDGREDREGVTRLQEDTPELKISDIEGDWRALPPRLMYRIRALPGMQKAADRTVVAVEENDGPPDYNDTILELQYQYARLGLKALILAIRLRRAAGLPHTRLADSQWSAQPVMWQVWCRERKRIAADVIRNAEWHKIVNAKDDLKADAGSDDHQRLAGDES